MTANTLHQYHTRLMNFIQYCRSIGQDWHNDQELDHLLCQYFQTLYFDGGNGDEGQKILAALGFFLGRYSRAGAGQLPRALLAVKGWLKITPRVNGSPCLGASCSHWPVAS